MKNGSGVAATLWIDGELVTFKLALVIDKDYGWASKDPKFAFVNEELKKIVDGSFYSGGETGFGRDTYEIKDLNERWEIVSTDLNYIINYQKEEEERREREKEKYKIKQAERVEKINALPEKEVIYETGAYGGLKVYVKRGIANYNPEYSSKIHFSYYMATEKIDWFDINDYITRDGKIKVKQFEKDMKHKFGVEPLTSKEGKLINTHIITGIDEAWKKYKTNINYILSN